MRTMGEDAVCLYVPKVRQGRQDSLDRLSSLSLSSAEGSEVSVQGSACEPHL